MKDFFGAYRKNAVRKNAAIAVSAFVFALSINAFLFGTDSGVRLQTSAVEYAAGSVKTDAPDLSLVSSGTGSDLAKIRLSKSAKAVKEIRATIVTDATSIKVKDVFSADASADVVKISNVDGIMLVNIRYKEPKDLVAGTDVAMIAFQKSVKTKTAVSLAETSFVSGNETYELSNSATEF